MAKIDNTLPPITTNTGGGTSIHNDLSGLNVGNYIHLTALEKTKFDSLPNTFAPVDAEKNVNTDWNAISGDEQLLNKPSTFPPSIHTHVEADITDLDKYTQLETDNLFNNKVDKVVGKGLSTEDYTTIEKSKLASITEIFTTALKTTYDDAVTWITTNGTNILNHIASTSNPHSVTASQVGLSNVDNTSDVNKPVSTDTQTALDLKADTDSTFPMRFQFSSTSLIRNTTYHAGGSNNIQLQTNNIRYIYAGITATSFRVSIFIYNTGVLGTSENVIISLLNNTQGTNIVLTSTAKTNITSFGFVGNFTFAITEGDSLTLRIETPNYSTQPTAVIGGVNLILKK